MKPDEDREFDWYTPPERLPEVKHDPTKKTITDYIAEMRRVVDQSKTDCALDVNEDKE